MKGIDLVKELQKNGWTLDRVNGSHHIMKNGDRIEVIPCHNKDLPKGLLMAIRKRTGL